MPERRIKKWVDDIAKVAGQIWRRTKVDGTVREKAYTQHLNLEGCE